MNTSKKSMKKLRAVVAERGQVTIPKLLREKLSLRPGTVLEFSEEKGRIVVVKSPHINPVDEVFGCLKGHVSVDELIDELRGRA
jgi:antitoxin PrlF